MTFVKKRFFTGLLICVMALSLILVPVTALKQGESFLKSTDLSVSKLMTDSVIDQLAVLNLEDTGTATLARTSSTATAKVVEDVVTGKEVRRIEFETFEVDIDQAGEVVSVRNYVDFNDDETSIIGGDNEDLSAYKVTEADVLEMAEKIVAEYGLEEYELVECTNDIVAVWILTWNKHLAENVLNPYDVMTVTVDAKDGSVMLMKRNTITPEETTPLITENEAVLKTQEIQSRLGNPGVASVELTVFRPNYYWELADGVYEEVDFVRLAWRITLEDASSVYVDARTGEVLGGSRALAVRGRAVSAVPSFTGSGECVNLAVGGLQRLGYTHHLNPVNYGLSQADIEYILNESNLKSLYLTCHGGFIRDDYLGREFTFISDSQSLNTANWAISSYQIEGGYKFVFLDACLSSSTDHFPNAFLGNNRTGKCFIGWNNSVAEVDAYYFNTQFWPLVGEMTILDAVLEARTNTLSAGCPSCNPGFSGDVGYDGRA